MKKFLAMALAVISVLCVYLSGCGAKDMYGTYSFQMGKEESTHIGIYVQLKNEDYIDDQGKPLGEKYELRMDLPDTQGLGLLGLLGDDSIEGYFNRGKEIDGGCRLELFIPFKEIIGTDISIPPELMTVDLKDGVLNFVLPVIFNDLLFQTYWYGYDLWLGDELAQKHDIGTHPTEQDIEEINKDFSTTHFDFETGEPVVYRDFHCLTLGLRREQYG